MLSNIARVAFLPNTTPRLVLARLGGDCRHLKLSEVWSSVLGQKLQLRWLVCAYRREATLAEHVVRESRAPHRSARLDVEEEMELVALRECARLKLDCLEYIGRGAIASVERCVRAAEWQAALMRSVAQSFLGRW